MSYVVAPIVEGYADVVAVPLLIRRLAPTLAVCRPVRFPRSQLTKPDRLAHYADIAAANIRDGGGLLLVMDADEDCPVTLGRDTVKDQLAKRFPNRIVRVALAVRRFEAWIVGGHAEYDVADADHAGKLEDRIRKMNGTYSKTVDQPRLIATADLSMLEARSKSFRHLVKVVREFEAASG